VWVTVETFAGVPMRVGWWRPGWGARHPAILFVIGATPEGIDFPQLRTAAEAFARGGYLVMIPELPFMKEERLDPDGSAQIAEAYALLRRHPSTGARAGAFGFSVGGGALLAAAAREEFLAAAPYLAVLGAYFDMRTYVAAVASRTQRRAGRRGVRKGGEDPILELVSWEPSPDVPERLQRSALRLARDDAERTALEGVLAARSYDDALARIEALPPRLRDALDALSPAPAWQRIAAPIHWLHDERDMYVPVAEAEAARRAPGRARPLRLVVMRLLQHAIPVADSARGQGPRFWASELWTLLRFAMTVLRAAG